MSNRHTTPETSQHLYDAGAWLDRYSAGWMRSVAADGTLRYDWQLMRYQYALYYREHPEPGITAAPAYDLHDLTALLPERFGYELGHVEERNRQIGERFVVAVSGPSPRSIRVVGTGRADTAVEALALAILDAIASGNLTFASTENRNA